MNKYLIVAYYYLCKLENPHKEVLNHQEFFKNRDVKGRIYLSEEGINGQISADVDEANAYMDWIKQKFPKISFKIQEEPEHVFYKMTVKYRKQLVAFDKKVDFSKKGKHVSPETWKKMLEEKGEDTFLIDVRNDYEWKVGHFEHAEHFPCSTFREFPAFTKQWKQGKDPKKAKVMMYCTGGIRCEYYSAYLKEEGFENVYQLEGGIINYGQKMGSKYWRGQLFVFDDRLTVPVSSEDSEIISTCQFCAKEISTYYNCSNMNCNELFLSCRDCIQENKGCCSDKCLEGRIRPCDLSAKPKPFRKISSEMKKQMFG